MRSGCFCSFVVVLAGRWLPDEQLVASVLAGGSTRMGDLGAADRCWVVAGLVAAGLTAEEVADRLGCSLRLVRSVRAEPMSAVCEWALGVGERAAGEVWRARGEVSGLRSELAGVVGERDRLRSRLGEVLDLLVVGEGVSVCGRGHELTVYNTYRHSGRRHCRECRRVWQREYRARGRGDGVTTVSGF